MQDESALSVILQRLPISLILLGIVDFIIFKELVQLYLGQIQQDDPLSVITFVSIFLLIIINLVVIIATFITSILSRKIENSEDNVTKEISKEA